jgi:hypothetical protein
MHNPREAIIDYEVGAAQYLTDIKEQGPQDAHLNSMV